MFLGITGYPCAGKGEAANILKDRGFRTISISDVLREKLREMSVPVTREHLVELANFIRERAGNGALMKMTIERIGTSNTIIESIRHPDEVLELKKAGGKFFFITAEPKTRFERIKERKREEDPQTWETFLKHELIEAGKGEGSGQRIRDCELMADTTIENNGTIEELKQKIDKILLEEAGKHPEQTKLPEMYNRE